MCQSSSKARTAEPVANRTKVRGFLLGHFLVNFKYSLVFRILDKKMIEKIKGIINSKDSIDEINAKLEEQFLRLNIVSRESSELKKEFSQIKEEIKDITEKQGKIMRELFESLNKISEARKVLEKEVDDFKILKSKMQKTMLEQMSDEFRRELMSNIERLKTDVASFNELKKEVESIAARTNKLGIEIEKLIHVSSRIKKEDFELTKYAQKILAADNEKLRLMRQIDVLERLISRERRRKAVY